MASVKVSGFLGKAPKASPELLPETNAQIANNCKLISGDIIPFPEPLDFANTGRTSASETLHALREPGTGTLKWLTWIGKEVKIATPSAALTADEQRFYYTGDGVPRVSNYALATASAPYPASSYHLGLPLPTTVPVTAPVTYTPMAVTFINRLSGKVTVEVENVGDGHLLQTGSRVSIRNYGQKMGTYGQAGTTVTVSAGAHGFTAANIGDVVPLHFTDGVGQDGDYTITVITDENTFDCEGVFDITTAFGQVNIDYASLNITNVEVRRIDDYTFSYDQAGFAVYSSSDVMDPGYDSSAGIIDLAGDQVLRTYVYTWMTPWDEESIPSSPSADAFVRESQLVDISNLPTATPSSDHFVRGIRLYRTVSSTIDTQYFRLATLWFPNPLVSGSITSNVATITLLYPHKRIVGDTIRIDTSTATDFEDDVEVLEVVDAYTLTYSLTAANAATAALTGFMYISVTDENVQLSVDGGTEFWGFSGEYDLEDTILTTALSNQLESESYSEPPADLKGLTAIQNNVLAGFVGKTLYFSEPRFPHAWPIEYAVSLDHNIVQLAFVSGALVVLTDGYPFIVMGSNPGQFAPQRLDALYPCVSSKSVLTLSYGVMWATHAGLALYSPQSGAVLATKQVYEPDTWKADLDPTTIVATTYDDNYFASYDGGGFIFAMKDDKTTYITTVTQEFTAAWYDTVNDFVYFITGELTGSGATENIFKWDDPDQDPLTAEWKSKVVILKDPTNIGAARVIADYDGAGLDYWELIEEFWDDIDEDWDDLSTTVTFKLWVDKVLVFEGDLVDSRVFRLPAGYRTDTFEFSVEGAIRVRAVHFGDTPKSLKGV